MAMNTYLRNMGAMIGQSTIQRLLGIVTTIILARVLGSADFGLYSIVVNTASSAYGLVRLGVDAAIHVHTAEHDADAESRVNKGRLLGAGLVLLSIAGLVGGVGCLAGASWIAENIYGKPELISWIRWAGFLVFMQCLAQYCYTLLVGLHYFFNYAKVMVYTSLLSVIALPLGSIFFGIFGSVIALISIQLISLTVLAKLAYKSLRKEHIMLTYKDLISSSKILLRNGLPFYYAGLIAVPSVYYIHGLLTQHAGLDVMGGYRVIGSITAIITFVPSSIAAVMVSHFTRDSSSNYNAFVESILINIKYVWLLSMMMGIAVITILPVIFNALFGIEYMNFTAPASIAVISTIPICLLGVIGNIAFSRKRVFFIFFYTLVQTIGFLIIAIIFVPEYGLVGYYVAELTGVFCSLCFVYIWTHSWRKRNRISPYWVPRLTLISVLCSSLFIFLGLYGTDSLRTLAGVVALCLVIFIAYTSLLGVDERHLIFAKMKNLRLFL